MATSEHIRKKLGTVPHKPGVYLHKDRFGTVIYVGKALDLRKRVSQYFHPSRRMGWDLKFNTLVEAIWDFDVHTVRSEPEALLLESKLIKEFKPRFNVSLRDDKRFLMLKVNLNDPIPNFTFTRLKKDDGARYFGPFVNSSALRNTLALARKQFNLRGCRVFTPGAADYKHCLYAHLKYCTAPCVGNVTREQYLEQVNAACHFLDGRSREMQADLEVEMKKAADAHEFERAADLRDLIRDLQDTWKKTEKFARVPYNLPLAINPQSDLVELAKVLDLPTLPQRIEGFDISNISGTFKVASLVSFKSGRPDRANYRRFKIKTVSGQDDFASIAEVVRRRYSRLLNESKIRLAAATPGEDGSLHLKDEGGELIPPELQKPDNETSWKVRRGLPVKEPGDKLPAVNQPAGAIPSNFNFQPAIFPDLILIDGGKGQLGMACEELKKLGLEKIPVIGLAKEFEEIYLPGKSEPLRLGLDHPVVKLLQRIRDECHRVANSYNAQLRLKKISESVLDEFPGIGERRKQALLKKFGSVQRMRMATLDQLAEVSGFGGKAAEELKKFLEARG
ncbi:MAG: excinuclease ABC subunit UvrC [Verrucomicrobiota bacterium]|jgi:excinuclease ABC subunit C